VDSRDRLIRSTLQTPLALSRLAVTFVAALVSACSAPGPMCASGERSICRSTTDCRCGASCSRSTDCTGRNICARFQSDPSGPGVCVDAAWLLGTEPPCLPLCSTGQTCINWGDRPNSCANSCNTASECPSGCCVPLRDGGGACAPDADLCGPCNPACATNQICVQFNRATCTVTCQADADCPTGCCVPLQGGGGACSLNGAFCPTMRPPPCRTLETCTTLMSQFSPASAGACGAHGRYDGTLLNGCGESAYCRACWFSPVTSAYTDCVVLGEVPAGATVVVGEPRCADVPLRDPPVRVRCIDAAGFFGTNDCLGSAPL